MNNQNPKALGLTMPAEWHSHSSVWLAWPYDETTFPKRVAKVENLYCQIIKALGSSETVELLVLNQPMKTKAETLLKEAGADLSNITFHITDYADVWVRDYGPIFVSSPATKELAWVKWAYNAYGKADDPYFSDLLKDNQVFLNLRGTIDKRMFEPGIILEGGAVEVNGEGTLLTTEQCLLNPNRNPYLTKNDLEKYLIDYLGVKKVIWLKEGLVNDHTDGHIDELARFVNKNTIVCAYEDNPQDANFPILDANYKQLQKASDQNGQPFTLVKLPMPHMAYENGEKAPVSYANFYIGNKVVLAATFRDPNDENALRILQSHFPDKKVLPIDCSDIIYGGGAIHCMTQQQPGF